MANKTETTTVVVNVSGNRYQVSRAEVNKDLLLDAFNKVKADTDALQNIVDQGQGALTINSAVIFRMLVYLLALGRLVIALAIRINRLEKS